MICRYEVIHLSGHCRVLPDPSHFRNEPFIPPASENIDNFESAERDPLHRFLSLRRTATRKVKPSSLRHLNPLMNSAAGLVGWFGSEVGGGLGMVETILNSSPLFRVLYRMLKALFSLCCSPTSHPVQTFFLLTSIDFKTFPNK